MGCCKRKNPQIKNNNKNTTSSGNKPSFVKSKRLPSGTYTRTCKVCFTRNTGIICVVCGASLSN